MCTYQDANGKPPCCTHDCDGCVWHEENKATMTQTEEIKQ